VALLQKRGVPVRSGNPCSAGGCSMDGCRLTTRREPRKITPAHNTPPITPRQLRGAFGGTPVRTSGANPAKNAGPSAACGGAHGRIIERGVAHLGILRADVSPLVHPVTPTGGEQLSQFLGTHFAQGQ